MASMRLRYCLGLSVVPWLGLCWASCSGERSEQRCPEGLVHMAPMVRPAGLLDEYWSCSNDNECKSGLCWRGMCYPKPPAPDAGGPIPNNEACSQDADCQTAFCDRGLCAQPFLPIHYGRECVPPENRRERERPCGSYICADGRCRSCQSDAECLYWTGAESCAAFGESQPGKTCGRLFDGGLPPDAPPATPPTVTPGPPGRYPQTPQIDPTDPGSDNPVTPCPPR